MNKRHFVASIRVAILLATAMTRSLEGQFVVDSFAGTSNIGDGGLAKNAFLREANVAIRDGNGGYYIADIGQNLVRYVNAAGVISTVLGVPFVYGFGPSGEKATQTAITEPAGLALDAQGNLFVAEYSACVVRKVDRQGNQTVVVGQVGRCGLGAASGLGPQVLLAFPSDLSMDAQGRLLIVDSFSPRIRRLDPSGNVTTVAGGGTNRADGIAATSAQLSGVYGLSAGAEGSFYYSETGPQNRVRRVDAAGIVTTIAGGSTANGGNAGDGGPATLATFSGDIRGVTFDASRNRLFVVDRSKHRVRVIDLATGVISHFAGEANATKGSYAGDDGPATSASLHFPMMAKLDSDGALLIADRSNHAIRRVSTNGTITTMAGRLRSIADTTALKAEISDTTDTAIDASGNVYIVDRGSNVIRRIDRQGQSTSIRSSLFEDLKGIGIDATETIFVLSGSKLIQIVGGEVDLQSAFDLTLGGFLAAPNRMAMDAARKKIYFAIPSRHQLSVMNLATTPPSYSSFAGNGTAGFAGDGGTAAAARLNSPQDMAADAAGNVYVADTGNNRLRRISAAGVIDSVAGNGSPSDGGDVVNSTGRVRPTSVAIDAAGRVVFADFVSVRRFDPTTKGLSTIAAGISVTPLPFGAAVGLFSGSTGDGGDSLYSPVVANWVRTDAAGRVFFGTNDNRVRYLQPYEITDVEIVSGDNQSVEISKALPAPLVVRANTNLGPIRNLTVNFNVVAGSATLNPVTSWYNRTDAGGQVRVTIQMGATAGQAQIQARADRKTATFTARALPAGASANRPVIRSSGGVISAASFGAGSTIAPGSWIEIYGTNLSTASRSWKDADFTGARAPVELEGVRVTIAGRNAYVAYVSPNQINAQVPDGIGTGPVDVVASTATNGSSDPVKVTAAAAAPGLLAPPSFLIGGTQYAVAIHSDGAFVGAADLIAGAAFRPAKAGDVLVLYGVGFGETNPKVAPGNVVASAASVSGVDIAFGTSPAQVLFAGLAPGAIGLYQFNVVVPAGAGTGNVPLRIRLGGAAVNQSFVLTLQE